MDCKKRTCMFSGHRSLPKEKIPHIYKRTLIKVEELIAMGYTGFYRGGAVGFDLLCGEIILSLKSQVPYIRLLLALPCKEQDKYFCEEDKKKYQNLLQKADEVTYITLIV